MVSLISLNLSNNQLSGSIPDGIGNLINLEELLLNNNQLSGNVPESISDLEIINDVTYLFNLENNNLFQLTNQQLRILHFYNHS